MTAVTAFAPATVSNVACGFDVLGFAMEAPGDEVSASFAGGKTTDGAGTVTIEDIEGDGGRLPRDGAKNTAGVAVRTLLQTLGEHRNITLRIRKGLPLSSGLGGSAASAAAAVVAVDALLGAASPLITLIASALEGERLGAGSAHADNVAPALCGGLVLVRRTSPPDVLQLPVPPGLTAVVVHPDIEIETSMARALLGSDVPLKDAVQQWANLGALVHGLHTGDFAVIGRSLEDTIAEPRRALARPRARCHQAGGGGCRGPRLQPVRLRTFALCPLQGTRRGSAGRRGDDGRRRARDRRRIADLSVAGRSAGRSCYWVRGSIRRKGVRPLYEVRHDSHRLVAPAARVPARGGRLGPGRRWRTLRPGNRRALGAWRVRAPAQSHPHRGGVSRPSPVYEDRSRREHVRSDRRRSTELSDSPRRGRAGHVRARAVSRSDAGLQGRRREDDGAADGRAGLRRRTAHRPGGHFRRHRRCSGPCLPPRATHPRRRALSGWARQPDPGSAADDVQLGGGERPSLRRCRKLRRLPAAHQGSLRGRRGSGVV